MVLSGRVCTQKRVMDGMRALSQGPLTARSSRPRRQRRMEIIDESQSACLRATNTYLSEAPCNHNKTGLLLAAAAAVALLQQQQRESSIPNNQFVPV